MKEKKCRKCFTQLIFEENFSRHRFFKKDYICDKCLKEYKKNYLILKKDLIVFNYFCLHCNIQLTSLNWNKSSLNKFDRICKKCALKKSKEWKKNNVQIVKQYEIKYKERKKELTFYWRQINLQHIKNYSLRYNYKNYKKTKIYQKNYRKKKLEEEKNIINLYDNIRYNCGFCVPMEVIRNNYEQMKKIYEDSKKNG